MDRAQKSELVAELKSSFESTSVVVITRNLGLSVAQSTALRTKMRDAGARYKVSKNSLARIAVEGTTYSNIADLLTGPTALSTSADPVAPAKVIVDFAKTNDKLEIVGGAMGDTLLDVAGVKALAELPSLDELAREDRGPDPGSRDQDRADRPGARRPDRARACGLCRQGQCGGRRLTFDIIDLNMGRWPRYGD